LIYKAFRISRQGILAAFVFFAGAYALSYSAYALLPAQRNAGTTRVFLLFVVLHTFWGYAVWRLGARLLDTSLLADKNADASLARPLFHSFSHLFSKLIPAFVLLPRLGIFAMQAWLSDDVYRYLWDGDILANGVNPYAFTPDSPTLAAFRDADGASVYAQMDYRSVPTIYPPLAQYCFAIAIIASRFWGYADWLAGYWTWKGLAVSAELVGLCIVWKIITQGENIARKRRQQKGFLAYCCLPLPIIEFAGQAHLDALLLPPLACLLFVIFRLFADDAPVCEYRCRLEVALRACRRKYAFVFVLRRLSRRRTVRSRNGGLGDCTGSGRRRISCRIPRRARRFLALQKWQNSKKPKKIKQLAFKQRSADKKGQKFFSFYFSPPLEELSAK
jgi:hypothetical protein